MQAYRINAGSHAGLTKSEGRIIGPIKIFRLFQKSIQNVVYPESFQIRNQHKSSTQFLQDSQNPLEYLTDFIYN